MQAIVPLYIGVMSGTSMDAIDMVVASFDPLQLHATHSVAFAPQLRDNLLLLSSGTAKHEIELMGNCEVQLAQAIATGIKHMLAKHNIEPRQISAIGSHGQTIRHRPDAHFSLQIGDPNHIAAHTGIPVVADFRRMDMAAGGQGAPLVPAFHQQVFAHQSTHRIILNLGGIANVTVLPARNSQLAVQGFDTGPANLLLDAWCHKHTLQQYDIDGQFAQQGRVQPALLELLLGHPYFGEPAPKSTGREVFNLAWLEQMLGQFNQATSAEDVQATLVELSTQSIANSIGQLGLSGGELYVCGGGAFNPLTMESLQQQLPHWQIHSTAALGLHPTWVEATAFAWLAMRRINHLPGNLVQVTGATAPQILGGLYVPYTKLN